MAPLICLPQGARSPFQPAQPLCGCVLNVTSTASLSSTGLNLSGNVLPQGTARPVTMPWSPVRLPFHPNLPEFLQASHRHPFFTLSCLSQRTT